MNIKELLSLMIKKGISDIHFKVGSSPLIRINGKLVSTGMENFSPEQVKELAYSFMNNDQKAFFEKENELDMGYSLDDVSRFRVNIYRQRGTAALSLRVVPLKVKNFEELNLPIEPLKKLAAEPRGLILMAGITGAGKTTTLNSIINYINENYQYNIITIEDPIEYCHTDLKSSIAQREVGIDTKSYSKALKSVLRQNPDVIAIGEMRDFEAISAGITAAETGHLVLSTIHTTNAVQTIDRIVDSYPPHQVNTVRSQIANVLKGIVAQRLLLKKDESGRIPATEILIATPLIKKQIIAGKLDELYKSLEQGTYYGMHTFDNSILEMYKQGLITYDEAIDKSSNPDDLMLKLKGIGI